MPAYRLTAEGACFPHFARERAQSARVSSVAARMIIVPASLRKASRHRRLTLEWKPSAVTWRPRGALAQASVGLHRGRR